MKCQRRTSRYLTCRLCRTSANNPLSNLPARTNFIKRAHTSQQENAYKCPAGASHTPESTSRHMLGHAAVKSCEQSPCKYELYGCSGSTHYKVQRGPGTETQAHRHAQLPTSVPRPSPSNSNRTRMALELHKRPCAIEHVCLQALSIV